MAKDYANSTWNLELCSYWEKLGLIVNVSATNADGNNTSEVRVRVTLSGTVLWHSI
jgi:hypothetical protein